MAPRGDLHLGNFHQEGLRIVAVRREVHVEEEEMREAEEEIQEDPVEGEDLINFPLNKFYADDTLMLETEVLDECISQNPGI